MPKIRIIEKFGKNVLFEKLRQVCLNKQLEILPCEKANFVSSK